jgi:hypothetical protein
LLKFGSEQTLGTPHELDQLSRWKYQRWQLAQFFPSMKPTDFDAAGDAPWFVKENFIDVRKFEILDASSVLKAQRAAKKKPDKK